MPQEKFLGQKKLTIETWLDPDETLSNFIVSNADPGNEASTLSENWASQVCAPQLNERVPNDIRTMFEVARGTMLYANFYYPLMTLASEQLYRVADAALAHRLDEPHKSKSLAKRIKIAAELKVISAAKIGLWEATRELRNLSSHPLEQSILPPGWALRTLEGTVDQINELFA